MRVAAARPGGHAGSYVLYLTFGAEATLAAASDDSRRLVPTGKTGVRDVIILDTFDGQITGSGNLLLAGTSELRLLGGTGHPVDQPGSVGGFLHDLPDGPVRETLEGVVSPLRRLIPRGEARECGQTVALLDDLDKTLLRGTLTELSTEAGAEATILEMTPLRGYETAATRLKNRLTSGYGLTGAGVRNIARHLSPQSFTYTAKPDLNLDRSRTAWRAATDIIAAHVEVARLNEDGIVADIDTEFLHDYRVALRRVRAVLSLFKGVYPRKMSTDLKSRFGDLMAMTGRTRDLDVYLIERDSYLAMVPDPLRSGLGLFFDSLAAERDSAHAELARHLQSKVYDREIRSLARLFNAPKKRLGKGPDADVRVRDFACRIISKRYVKVRAIASEIDHATPDARVHALRIECKKLRYALEFFAPAFDGRKVGRLVKALKKLQDVLGIFNDCVVQQKELSNRLDRIDQSDPRRIEMAKSLGALLTILDQRKREARAEVAASFASLDAPATRKGFRTLFHAPKVTV